MTVPDPARCIPLLAFLNQAGTLNFYRDCAIVPR